jgi:hypothetical protein
MSNKDFIPRGDAPFDGWQKNFMKYFVLHNPSWNVPITVAPKLLALQSTWDNAYAVTQSIETRTKAAVQIKVDARNAYEGELRTDIKAYVTYNPDVTDADRDNMGLPIHDTKPTPVPPPTEHNIVEVDVSSTQKHIITVKPSGTSKPANAHGFEIWRKVGGELPTTDEEFSYAGFSTHSPFTIDYPLSDTGKTVYYRSHWVNSKNQPGPWSKIISAIIA